MQKITDQKDDEGSLQRLAPESAAIFLVVFMHYKRHGVTNCEEERGEDKISGCKAVPFGMEEWCVNRSPVAGIVDDNHETHGHAAENIEGEVALIF